MVSNGKFLQFLKLIFFVTGLCAGVPNSVRAENTSSRAGDDRAFKSFVDYEPRTSQFPAALQPAVDNIANARQAAKNKHPDEAAQGFRSALSNLQALERSLNRGYADQAAFLRGFAQEGLNQNKEALSSYKEALSIRPNNMLALFRHALLLKQMNRCNEALPELHEVAWQVKPLSYELDFLAGECLIALNRADEGLASLQAAYAKNPSFPPLARKMADTRKNVLAQTADPKKRSDLEAQLVNDYNSILRQNPDDRETSIALASLLMRVNDPLLESGKLSKAEALVQKLAESSSYKDDVAVRMLFQIQLRQGDLASAEQTLNRGLQAAPSSKELASAKQQFEIEKTVRATPPAADDAAAKKTS
ncbi:MAG: tetratricopeptide repeat protein [Bdellovibrionota bacterium]